MKFDTIIMAGGLGKRMNSTLPKVLHKINGLPMLVKIINQVKQINEHNNIYIIVGKYKPIIKITLEEYGVYEGIDIEFILQEEALGTGHAIMCAKEYLSDKPILILSGDIPLITSSTIQNMLNNYNNVGTIMTTELDEPYGNGRIIRYDRYFSIVEEKDADIKQKKIKEVNCGIYVFNSQLLKNNIIKLTNNNAQKEFYLTDIVKFIPCNIYKLPIQQQYELTNVNTKETLDKLNIILQSE